MTNETINLIIVGLYTAANLWMITRPGAMKAIWDDDMSIKGDQNP